MAQQTINLGRVACNPMGIYSAATTYNRLDMVMYGGTGYICCANNVTNVTPSTDDTKWKPIVDASQISEFTVEELIMTSSDGIMADITTDANGIAIDTNSITIDSGNDSVHVAGDTVTITDGNDTATIKSNSLKVEDVDNEFTEITSTQVNTPEVFTKKVAFENSEIGEIDDGENLILQMRAGIIDIDADAISLSDVNTQKLVANSSQSLINIESYNPDSQIILHKNGKTVQLKDGVLNTDVANVKELNMNADGDMGGVIVFGDKNGSENIIELSEREDDQLAIKAPEIDFTAPSNTPGLPNIYFKQKYGTSSFDNYNPLSLTWDNYSSGSNRKRPNITTALGLSMNSGVFDSPIYFNYANVWSNLHTFKFQNIELPYTWRGSTITPTFKVGNYQIKHINGQWGQEEIGEYGAGRAVYDYNYNHFFGGLNLTTRYSDGEGDYEDQQYMYFNTFNGDDGQQSGVINAEFGLNYSGKELNIWNWDESDKMTLKTVHDDNTDITEHIISAPNKLTVSSETQVVIRTPTTHINSDEVNISSDSVDINSDNDIDLTTSTKVSINGNLVIASGNTLKIGNTVITEAQLQALLNLL
jgi:hypothetical protein